MLHIIKNFSFSIKDSIKNIIKALISSFGILFLISFLVLYISLRDSVKNYIENNIFGKLAINEVKIYPKTSRDNQFFSTASSITGKISIPKVKKIRKMTELENIDSIIKMDYEVKVRGELLGQGMRVHIPLYGINKYFFKGKDPNWKKFKNIDPVPMIAPRFVLEMLNNYFTIIDMPAMTPETLKGFPLKIFIYTQTPSGEKKNRYLFNGEAHSFTDVLTLPGLIVPTDFIVKFSQKHKMDSGKAAKGYSYTMIIAKVKDIKKIPAITKRLKNMGLMVESQDDIAKKTNNVLKIIDDSSLVIIAILLILTIISIFNSYLTIVYNRSQNFSLKRVLGVPKIRIIMNFVIEAAVVGVLYGIIGYYTGNYLIENFSKYISQWVPTLKHISVDSSREGILIMAVGLSALISSISALIPAIFASNINLFKAIKK